MQDTYGIDWEGPISPDIESVNVPDTECPFSTDQLDLLKETINPLEESDDYGVQLYITTRMFVNCITSCNTY